MTPGIFLRLLALACVVLAVAWAFRASVQSVACSTALGACRQTGAPPCLMRLGDWQVARARDSGLPNDRSRSACIVAATGPSVRVDGRGPGDVVSGESFALDLALREAGDGFWLDAEVAALELPSDRGVTERRPLGRLRQRLAAPRWLGPAASDHALFVVIPDPDPATYTPTTRVDLSRFARLDAETPR